MGSSDEATTPTSRQFVQAADRRNTAKELARSVRYFLNQGSHWHYQEMRQALKRYDEAHRE